MTCPDIVSNSSAVLFVAWLWEWEWLGGPADPRIRCFATFRKETWAMWNFVEILDSVFVDGYSFLVSLIAVTICFLLNCYYLRRYGCRIWLETWLLLALFLFVGCASEWLLEQI